MESTSEANRIQLSQSTANLIEAAGKSHWFVAREEKVHAKGKGELQTYWLVTTSAAADSKSAENRSLISGGSSRGDEDDMVSGDLSYLESALKERINEEHKPRNSQEVKPFNDDIEC